MATSAIFFSFFLTLSLHVSADNPNDICPVTFCHPGGPEIRFPFRVRDVQPERCGYAGFNVWCNNRGQAILQLPYWRDFVVDLIDYEQQYVRLKDPSNCLAKQLENWTFSTSLFGAQEYRSFMFANCSVDLSDFRIKRVCCLSDQHHTVMLSADDGFPGYFLEFRCRTWTVLVPVARQYPTDITETVFVKWDRPGCRSCERSGRSCRLKGSAGSHVECFGKHGLSKRTKFWILSGVTLSSLLCMFGTACYLRWRARVSRHRGRRGQPPNDNDGENNVTNISFPSSPSRQTRRTSIRVTGLNSCTIESYPKIQVDDDGQVPKPIDNICAICLSVYQPKETLRTIPMCGHYFHAQCIDLWLRRNASCPLCRDHKGSSNSITASN